VKDTLGLDFPSVPYLIDGQVKMTDVNAIMVYLSNAYAPELLGKDADEKGTMDMYWSQLKEIKQHITGPCYV
jgi:glutathione S-transferase